MHPVDLVPPTGPGGHRDREPQLRRSGPDKFRHAVLAGPGGTGKDRETSRWADIVMRTHCLFLHGEWN
ncbi:hypothetical protein GCM10022225_67290 [Plantactinospora mayteni]|uniref:Uncharacterized protein n=1 Tax=Plantactinospora mayteni TaxID=566021 RepID=A0ABQ4EV54_9ACTN|nr:hypothetical protein Pma05_51010 [Plantactinospora mayteni]